MNTILTYDLRRSHELENKRLIFMEKQNKL